MLSDILQPRAEELMGLVRDEVKRVGLGGDLRSGYVLTGGGSDITDSVRATTSDRRW